MNTNEPVRGYDDTRYLKEMAAGIVSRKYGSVDEAAKAVLEEEAGSNVDRLRRKFREQNWYEKGLADYVEAEIAGRDLMPVPRYVSVIRALRGKLSSSSLRPVAQIKSPVAVIKQNRPKGSVTAAVVSATALFGAVAAGGVSTTHALMAFLATSLFVTVFWADQASEGADYKQARTHLSLIAGLIAVAVAAFAYLAPAPSFTLGSFAGTVAAAMGLTAAGVYLTSFVSVRAKREGRRRSLEVSALIIAISILSQSGTALMVHDSQLVNAQTAALDISAK